jgi:nitrogen fixation NifU-like protein
MPEDYNATVLEHFTRPRNVGTARGANAEAAVENPQCGDLVKLSLRVEDGVVREAKMKTFGCAAAIASASMLTTMVVGRTVAEALALRDADVVAALGGLPPGKAACSVLAQQVLARALQDRARKD